MSALGDLLLGGVEGGLRLGGVADIYLLLLRCRGEVGEVHPLMCGARTKLLAEIGNGQLLGIVTAL